MLWRDQTGLDREPRVGEQLSYQYSIKTEKTATTLKEREFKTMIFDSILEDVKLQLENEMSYEDILRLRAEYGAGNVTAVAEARELYEKVDELQKRLDAAFRVLSQLNALDDEAHKRWKREACMFSQGESNAYEHAVRLLEQTLNGGSDE